MHKFISIPVRIIYNVVTFFLSFVLLPLFLLHPRGRIRVGERFGFWGNLPAEVVWFHGASVGEMNGLIPILERLKSLHPNLHYLVTATSPTGLDRARRYADSLKILPFDCELWHRIALRQTKVKLFVFSEIEVWPALLWTLSRQNAPSFLVNARVSDSTYRTYSLLTFIVSPLLQSLRGVFTGNMESLERLKMLGVPSERLSVSGNAKYDVKPMVELLDRNKKRLELFASDDPVLTLGSLRPGEEKYWFPEIAAALERKTLPNIAIAPRHLEKLEFFADELEKNGIPFTRRSDRSPSRVVLFDTMGELEACYSISNAAFVGGTLENYGGHNPLEPAMYGVAVSGGRFVSSVREIVQEMKEDGAYIELRTREDVRILLERVMTNDPSLQEGGKRSKSYWEKKRGAVERVMPQLSSCL